MKSVVFIAVLSLAAGVAAVPAASSEEEKILQLARDWCAAFLHNDAAALTRIEVPDFTLTNSRGEVSTLADDLKEIADGKI